MDAPILYLNLDQVNLFGWEEAKSDRAVDAIVRGVEARDQFPEVEVYEINPFNYEIAKNPADEGSERLSGGHHRAVGHYIADGSLRCKIIGKKQAVSPNAINIRDIVLVDDDKIDERGIFDDGIQKLAVHSYEQIKAREPHYR